MVTVNIAATMAEVKSIFDLITDREYLLRPLAIETIANIKERIHEQGKASDGAQIGTYSSGYMRVRTGNYGNAVKDKKGKVKKAGAFTKGKNAFSDVATKKANLRPNYNRSSDTKVIVSLTRQLENDYQVIATQRGYAIGFNNSLNFDKSQWVEANQKKIIFNTTAEEKDYILERAVELVNDAINGS